MAIERIDDNRVRIPKEGGMRVDGIVYASRPMLEEILKDKSLEQVKNVAHLPGILGASLAMPDVHWGYGFPIGGVAAFDPDEGVLSPGGVGYDINCGVRLMRSNLTREDVTPRLEDLSIALHRAIPAGMKSQSKVKLSNADLARVLVHGAKWAVQQGYGRADDLEVIEEGGAFAGSDTNVVSDRAKERGKPQLGSLGSGNHFAELGVVTEVYDEEVAAAFGLRKGEITIMIHSGSRGLGHQVCDDHLHRMLKAAEQHGIALPDRQLAAAPLGSDAAKRYFAAMACAVNFAFANRQMMTSFVRAELSRFFRESEETLGLELVYDVCHNIAKWEEHTVDGEKRTVCVHRKGATRAFGPGHPSVPERYRAVGQPVIVPGDMGRYSYVLVGTEKAMQETWGSSCHGAGRKLSRGAAKRLAAGRPIFRELEARGIYVRCDSKAGVAEEISEAYKDVAEVVDVIDGAGIAKKVARLDPLAVVKG